MALIPCPECQKEVSTGALACPQCALPFPGKNFQTGTQDNSRLYNCPDCGCPVSKQAQTCPHCGVSLLAERNGTPRVEMEEGMAEETWLCPHCATPYTRKVKRSGSSVESSPQKAALVSQALSGTHSLKGEDQGLLVPSECPTSQPVRRRPVLWQDLAGSGKEIETAVPRYPRSRKKSILLVMVVLLLVVVAGALGVLWQLKGITPLELLTSLQL